MLKFKLNKSGIALFIVLGTLLVVIILGNVMLSIILSQSRLTHHQISRIRAYYACLAGMNYAFEMLRSGVWGTDSYALCPTADTGCSLVDSDLPFRVNITIGAMGTGLPGTRPVNITVDYTYNL